MEALSLFRHAWVLAFLVLPAALALWTWMRAGSGIALPFDHARGGSGRWLRVTLQSAETLPALVLALAIVLAAGPQAWDVPKSKRVLTNIEFCVDVSGSMTAKFGDGDRYAGAMSAITQFVEQRQGDAYGLTFFGNNVLHWVPLTTDISAIQHAPPFMHPRNLPGWFQGTMIGKALRACRKVLVERDEGDRMIILVSDGESFDLEDGADEEIAKELRADGIVVYMVHIGDGDIPATVVRIAALSGGEAFKPEDKDGLAHVFARIDSMQKTRMEKTRSEATDDFVPWSFAGLVLLGALLLCSFGLRATPW
ncbi:MAG: VWA domain-containing protein [Planctomycetes bacterium]|nr:VWA domain-containing protein [Planctomycetota bacterium]